MYIGLITGMMLAAAYIQLAALSTDWTDTLSLSSESQLLQIARTSADVMVACNVYNNGSEEYDTKMTEANYSLVTVSEEFIDPLVRNCIEFNYQERNGTKRRNKSKVIFPGTKWCGMGDKAKNDGDLGKYNETDKCCRAHDKCEIYIDAFGNNYNLFNLALYTVMSCDCNAMFRDCLMTAAKASTTTDNDKWAANTVGNLYFNYISPKCLQLVYPTICIRWSWWGRCTEYAQDTTKAKVWIFKKNYLIYSS